MAHAPAELAGAWWTRQTNGALGATVAGPACSDIFKVFPSGQGPSNDSAHSPTCCSRNPRARVRCLEIQVPPSYMGVPFCFL